jgi:TPR repeat protein
MMYAMGYGVPKGYVVAYVWLNLAAAQGNKEAAEGRDKIARLMTLAQIGD